MRTMDLPEHDHLHPEPKGPDLEGVIKFQDELIRELRGVIEAQDRKCQRYEEMLRVAEYVRRQGYGQVGQIVGANLQQQAALSQQNAVQQQMLAQQAMWINQAQATVAEGLAWNGHNQQAGQQARPLGASEAPHLSMQNAIAQSLRGQRGRSNNSKMS